MASEVAALKACTQLHTNCDYAMSRTHAQLWFHVAWSTRLEQRVLTPELQPVLLDHFRAATRNIDTHIEAINAVENHIHALLRLLPRVTLADTVDRLKGGSAHWINTLQLTPTHFAWEPTYVACTVDPSQVQDVSRFVHSQDDIHQRMTYAEEAIAISSRDAGTLWRRYQ
jgi:putative transposase